MGEVVGDMVGLAVLGEIVGEYVVPSRVPDQLSRKSSWQPVLPVQSAKSSSFSQSLAPTLAHKASAFAWVSEG